MATLIANALLASLIIATGSGTPVSTTNKTRPQCHDLMLDIPLVATNYEIDVVKINNNIEAIEFTVDIDRWTSPKATERILGEVHINDTFSVYAQLCFPPPAKDKHVMQILSHGGIFDHRYWDSQLDPTQYSYVLAAVNAGYTVLNYDRLGTGLSEKADACTVVQGPLEVELLQALTGMVHKGSLLAASAAGYYYSPALHLPSFEKVVHTGHSLGSQITAAFLKKYGGQSSGAILTGFTFPTRTGLNTASAFGLEFAATNNPALYGDFPGGYAVSATVSNLQTCFSHRDNASDPNGFTDDALYYGESIKQPISVGQGLSTRGLLDEGFSPDFHGPLQMVLGEFDYLVCQGDCDGDFDPAFPKTVYPNATAIETHVVLGAGHGLTLHRHANEGYAVSLAFLDRNGL